MYLKLSDQPEETASLTAFKASVKVFASAAAALPLSPISVVSSPYSARVATNASALIHLLLPKAYSM